MNQKSPSRKAPRTIASYFRQPRGTLAGALGSLVLFIFSGCSNRPASDGQRPVKAIDNARAAAAQKLLDEVLETYARADAYHDDARIIIRYRMNGSPMEEHQLWAVDFRRPGQMAARLFNSRIQSDQNRTTAMVFNFDSQNMDNQFLVLKSANGPPWNDMFSDPVCRHFISGSSEIPFNSRLPTELNLPPTIGMLLGNPTVQWLQQPDRVELLDDAQANGKTFRRIRLEHNRRLFELWIDSQSRLIEQAILPNQFLDDALLVSPEITDLRLTVQFVAATFAPDWTTNPFSTELPESANPVSHFVPLPEAFPSEFIGKSLSPISVTAESGLETTWSPASTTTVLAWVDRQDTSLELIRSLDELVSKSRDKPLRVQLCYVEFADPNPQSQRPIDLPQFIRDGHIRLPIVADVGLAAGEKLGVKFAPTVLILDDSGVVQFFRSLSDDKWQTELPAAIIRVQDGDNLASEMRAEYAKFIDEYHNNLLKFNPLALDNDPTTKPVSHHRLASPRKLEPPLWQFNDAKLPGNILSQTESSLSPDSGEESQTSSLAPASGERVRVRGRLDANRLLINDGWQTVIELDPQTQTAHRHQLELDPEMSVTTLRPFRNDKAIRVAAFSEMGRQVLIVNDDWKTVGSFTSEPDSQVRDVQVSDHDSDGACEFWLLETKSFPRPTLQGSAKSFPLPRLRGRGQGEGEIDNSDTFLTQYDETLTKQLDQIKIESAESFIAISSPSPPNSWRFLVVRSDGSIVAISSDLRPQTPITIGQLKIRRLFPSPAPNLLACAVALNEHGQWQALGINGQLEIAWTQPIGPQEFDRQIQPIAALVLEPTHALFAFAASDNTITILSADGDPIDSLQWPTPIQGIAIIEREGAPILIVSDSTQITATSVETATVVSHSPR